MITTSKFDKLAAIRGVTNDKLKKYDLSIIFKTCISSDTRAMDFVGFARAMTLVFLKRSYGSSNASKIIEKFGYEHLNETMMMFPEFINEISTE